MVLSFVHHILLDSDTRIVPLNRHTVRTKTIVDKRLQLKLSVTSPHAPA